MPGFFETIAVNPAHRPLRAAWVVEGASIGARALYALDAEVYRDPAFPTEAVDLIRQPCGLPPSPKGEGYEPPAFPFRGRWPSEARSDEVAVAPSAPRLFLEPIARTRRLVICGAGHVSMPVIKIAAMLNCAVTVIDDRRAFAERARAAGAHAVICQPFAEALDGIEGDDATAFVIMTREHAHDVDCLRRILGKPRAYAGMMGSKSRTEAIQRQLLAESFDAEAVQNVRMPIGLPINSRTPEEIAVSVMAEVTQVMNAADAGESFPPRMLDALVQLERGEGRPAVLAMIVEKVGEAPRRPGTKMLVQSDGTFLGTVGGGAAEAMILDTARGMLRANDRQSRLLRVALEKGTMRCGGEIAVLLMPI